MFLFSHKVFAIPMVWDFNDHHYEAVAAEGDIALLSWEEARDWASSLTYTDASTGITYTGHLATITSHEENTFIAQLAGETTDLEHYMLGGYQSPPNPESDFAADWHWVTGEEWAYDNWRSGEPNNEFRYAGAPGYGWTEQYLQFFTYKSRPSPGLWNDVFYGTDTWDVDGKEYTFGDFGYIVEYESPAPVPEPATLILFGTGIVGLIGARIRKKK